MVHEENVMTPEGMLRLLDLHERIGNVEFNGSRYSDLCLEIPITDILMSDQGREREGAIQWEIKGTKALRDHP